MEELDEGPVFYIGARGEEEEEEEEEIYHYIHKSPPYVRILSSSHFLKIHFNISCPPMPRSFRWFLSFRFLHRNSLLSPICVDRDSSDYLRAGRSGDRISVGARVSEPILTVPGAHPVSYTMDTGLFPGVKRLVHAVNYPPPSSATVKERVDLYF
jgi:hypothetical protein